MSPPSQQQQQTSQRKPVSHLRLYLAAMLVDTLGSGLWMPVTLIFFISAQGLPIGQVGLAMTLGGIVGLLTAPWSGSIVDRWGPGRFILISNVIRFFVFLLYPFVTSAWQVALLAAVFAGAERMFWTANTPLMYSMAKGRALDRILATQNVIRIAGLGVGAAASGLFIGSVVGLHLIAYINAATYVIAAVITWFVVGRASPATKTTDGADPRRGPGWRSVIADRPYLGLVTVQALFALCAMSFVAILPLAAYETLNGPAWLPGAAIVVGNVVLALGQKSVVRVSEHTTRLNALIVASVVFTISFVMLAPAALFDLRTVIVLVLAASVIGSIAEAIFGPLMTAAANDAASDELRGRYSALFQTSWGLATVLAPALFTALLTVGNAALWLSCAVLALATIPVLLLVANKLPERCLRA